jgi:hypothetical protein
MKLATTLAAIGLVVATCGATSALADPGKGNGKGHGKHYDDRGKRGHVEHSGYRLDCPPGLAKKNPPCVPPGQAKKHDIHYGNRVGDVLRIGDYVVVRDPSRYDLQPRQGWDYYRDDDRIYRVDSGTRKVLAVLNLIDAFSN